MSYKELVWQEVLEWQNMTDGWRSPMCKYRRTNKTLRLLLVLFGVAMALASLGSNHAPHLITPAIS